MAQNGSENGSGGCSEGPEADSSPSRPGNFLFRSELRSRPGLGSGFWRFSELWELTLSEF